MAEERVPGSWEDWMWRSSPANFEVRRLLKVSEKDNLYKQSKNKE